MGGKILTAIFELAGRRFMALDGGPLFKFSEAVSFYVECADQEEVGHFWLKLSVVPEAEACGWLKDKFGLSWQIIPKQLGELLSDPDRERAGVTPPQITNYPVERGGGALCAPAVPGSGPPRRTGPRIAVRLPIPSARRRRELVYALEEREHLS